MKSALLRMHNYVIVSLLKPGIDQTVMHAPPFSLECVVSDFCFPDAVHLHFSKSSSSMKMCVVSSDSDFDLCFDDMCFATPFWLTGC